MPQPRLMTLAQWAGGADWRANLPHSCADHALIWITRGQGIALVEGLRRGLGVHNALAIPVGTLFALDLGRQGFGHVCLIPPDCGLLMPDQPQHLRIRDVQAQTELTALFEAMSREQNADRPFTDEALHALGAQMTVWLRRAMIAHDPTTQDNAAERLVNAYASLIERDHASTRSMADHARTLGVTPTHLSRVCRQCSGLTAAELLTRRCLHAARDRLEQDSAPIRQVAADLGFGSAAYFSRFILHHTGLSPSDLRARGGARLHGGGTA